MENPFVYGEVVPCRPSSIARRAEAAGRPTCSAGQKVFLISPRRYGKSSLDPSGARQAARRGLPDRRADRQRASVPMSPSSKATRAPSSRPRRASRARSTWFREAIAATRPEVRVEAGPGGASAVSVAFPSVRSARDVARLAPEVFALPARIADVQQPAPRRRARRVPGHRRLQRRQRRTGAPGRGTAPAPGRLRLRRLRADADGAHDRPAAAVLQRRTGHAAREDPGRPSSPPSSSALPPDRPQAGARTRRRHRRARRQPAVRCPATGARDVGRCARRRDAQRGARRPARDAAAPARRAGAVLRGRVAEAHARPARRPARGSSSKTDAACCRPTCARATGSAAHRPCRRRSARSSRQTSSCATGGPLRGGGLAPARVGRAEDLLMMRADRCSAATRAANAASCAPGRSTTGPTPRSCTIITAVFPDLLLGGGGRGPAAGGRDRALRLGDDDWR